MSSSAAADVSVHAPPSDAFSLGRRVLILVMVVMGSTLYATTLLIASTLLPQMQGTMSATQDEIAWAMTFNILATAVATPTTGWLAARFGRRETMTWSVLAFTVTTFLCGSANSLETLILWRVLQGALGAPVIPLSQTILLDAFPKRQQGLVTSIFGMAVVIGPVIGPTVGGMLSEIYSWRWAFYMIVPVGLISFVGLRLTLPHDRPTGRVALDWTGFLSLSVAIACVQLVLSRGQRLDWFELRRDHHRDVRGRASLLDLRRPQPHRDPALPQSSPAARSQLCARPGAGADLRHVELHADGAAAAAPAAACRLSRCADRRDHRRARRRRHHRLLPRHLHRPHGPAHRADRRLRPADDLRRVADGHRPQRRHRHPDANSLVQGIAIGVIWVPLTLVTFSTIGSANLAEGTAVYHLLRNIGSSFFISICVAEIVRATSANYSRLVELVNPYNRSLALPWVTGGWDTETVGGLAKLSKEIGRQAAMLGYINAFGFYTLASALAIPLILFVGRRARAR